MMFTEYFDRNFWKMLIPTMKIPAIPVISRKSLFISFREIRSYDLSYNHFLCSSCKVLKLCRARFPPKII